MIQPQMDADGKEHPSVQKNFRLQGGRATNKDQLESPDVVSYKQFNR
jgi:hypothetical protein